MAAQEKVAGYFWFKFSIVLGLLLGLLLLGQTVGSYYVVSRAMVHQAALSEADSQAQLLARETRRTGSRDAATLTPFIDELIKGAPEKIAWMRILNTDGSVIAAGGDLKAAPKWTEAALRNVTGGRGSAPNVGDNILLSVSPLRFGGGFGRNGGGPPQPPGFPNAGRGGGQFDFGRGTPFDPLAVPAVPAGLPRGVSGGRGGPGRGPGGPFVETAIYLDGVSVRYASLLLPLSVGVSAAIALLLAVIIIGLRFRHYIRGKQYEEELALARRVQNDLFPTEDIPTGNVEYAARFVPAREVGGDLYDVFETDDGGVGMVLGDVSGKGLSAALLMGVVQGAVRTSSDAGLAEHHEYSAERLNHLLCMKTARERFVSLFWCYLNKNSTRLSYINAGHMPALLVRERFGRPDVWRLEQGGGPVLGVVPGAKYKQAEIDIEPGDLFIVFSDGISEAANIQGDEFGEEGIVNSVMRDWRKPAAEVCDGILADIRTFLDKQLPHDDQTLMVVRLQQQQAEKATDSAQAAALPAVI